MTGGKKKKKKINNNNGFKQIQEKGNGVSQERTTILLICKKRNTEVQYKSETSIKIANNKQQN